MNRHSDRKVCGNGKLAILYSFNYKNILNFSYEYIDVTPTLKQLSTKQSTHTSTVDYYVLLSRVKGL